MKCKIINHNKYIEQSETLLQTIEQKIKDQVKEFKTVLSWLLQHFLTYHLFATWFNLWEFFFISIVYIYSLQRYSYFKKFLCIGLKIINEGYMLININDWEPLHFESVDANPIRPKRLMISWTKRHIKKLFFQFTVINLWDLCFTHV